MDRPPIIGIAGRARSGKDTVADFLIARFGGYKYSFADPIRNMLRHIGVDLYDPYWEDKKEDIIPALQVSPRYLMQSLGTEWGRDLVNPDLWVLLAKNRFLNMGAGMVLPDVRMENEAAFIRKHRGYVIHLTRDAASSVRPHKTENGIKVHKGDLFLENNGTLEDLQHRTRSLFDEQKT